MTDIVDRIQVWSGQCYIILIKIEMQSYIFTKKNAIMNAVLLYMGIQGTHLVIFYGTYMSQVMGIN